MTGPPIGPVGEDITWPDQVAPRAEECLEPEMSNLKPLTLYVLSSMDHPPLDQQLWFCVLCHLL